MVIVTMQTSTAGIWGEPTGPSLTGSTGTPGPATTTASRRR